MKTSALLISAAVLFAVAPASPLVAAEEPSAARYITSLLTVQCAAWNRGDLDQFMEAYAQTDTLRFASGGSVTLGWRPTLEGYKQRYPDKATMGTLAFTELEITLLAPDAAIAFGRWTLTREKDKPTGLFTLTLRKMGTQWRIIQDHTSSGS